MQLVDTHTHLFLEEFDEDRDQVVKNSLDAGVTKLILPNIDSTSIKPLDKMVSDYPGTCYGAMGLHPSSVKENFRDELAVIKERLYAGDYVAVGEIGIDLYWDKTFIEEQIIAFEEQIEWALDLELPIIIHARDSFPEIFESLNKFDKLPKGVFHCFSGSNADAHKAIEMGFVLGINGVVTFKKSNLPEVLSDIDLKHIILETDSPYLAPVPYRGKRNESAYVFNISQKMAELYGVSNQEVASVTTGSALQLFQLK